MKKFIPQISTAIIALVALTFLMSYTRPAADEAKQYILIQVSDGYNQSKFEEAINNKIAEGWRPQGGVTWAANKYTQAMVK